jgi:hypothetical protein
MSAARILGVLFPLVFLIAVFGIPWMLRREKRQPTSYPRRLSSQEAEVRVAEGRVPSLEEWRQLEGGQAAWDAAVLRASAVAEENARDAARLAVERAANTNALYHP